MEGVSTAEIIESITERDLKRESIPAREAVESDEDAIPETHEQVEARLAGSFRLLQEMELFSEKEITTVEDRVLSATSAADLQELAGYYSEQARQLKAQLPTNPPTDFSGRFSPHYEVAGHILQASTYAEIAQDLEKLMVLRFPKEASVEELDTIAG